MKSRMKEKQRLQRISISFMKHCNSVVSRPILIFLLRVLESCQNKAFFVQAAIEFFPIRSV